MGMKQLPKDDNTNGLNPDGTLACGTMEQMRPLIEQWKRWQEMYERGEIPDEPIVTVKPVAASVRCRLSPTADVPSHTSGAAMCRH
jgi:hypothetical protein